MLFPHVFFQIESEFVTTVDSFSFTLSEAWSGVNWVVLMAARTIVAKMLWTEYRPVIKIGPKGALGGSHGCPSLGQSIVNLLELTQSDNDDSPNAR